MSSDAGAARARRWVLGTAFLLLLAVVLLRAPANLELFLETLFSATSLGHLLALGGAFWLGLRAAASSQQAIFDLSETRQAQRHVLQAAFNGHYDTLTVQNGEAIPDKRASALIKVGGPGKVQVHMENAAVFETGRGQGRVLAPGERAEILRGFERMRAIIDLRDQVLQLNLWGRTRDGIRVRVEGARVVYSILRGKREATLKAPHPFEDEAALRLVYEQRVEKGVGTAQQTSRKLGLLGAQGAAFFERQLQAFLGEFTLGELLAAPKNGTLSEEERKGTLFLDREGIRQQFAARCEEAAAAQGLQLQWIDTGSWKVDELAQEILEDYVEEHGAEVTASELSPYQDSRAKELNRLFEQLAQFDPEELERTDRKRSYARLISAYYGLFDGLKLHYGNLLQDDERQLELVMRFLKLLHKRLGV